MQSFIYISIVHFASILVAFVASNNENLLSGNSRGAMSPFGITLKNAGWRGGADLINAFIFKDIFFATNVSVYLGSRTLYALADLG
jgi:amino acid transporter